MSEVGQNLLGVLLGQAVDQDGKYLSNVVLIDIGTDPQKAISKIQSFISDLAGRFIVFFNFKNIRNGERIYCDAASSFSAVFDQKSGIVASSLLLC